MAATSETSEELSRRPRGILPGSYTVHSLELDAAIAWVGVGVGAGVVATIAGGGVASGDGAEVGRAGIALRVTGVGVALARSGVADTTGVGVGAATGIGVGAARGGVATGKGAG